jgi:hypothetical protein
MRHRTISSWSSWRLTPMPPLDPPLPSPPLMARNSSTRPPPPSVLLALHLPPTAVAATMVVVAVAMVAVRLLLAVARAREALPGPRSTTLGLTPSTCGHAHPRVLLHPIHLSTSLPSSLHHSTALRHSRWGPRSHLPWHLFDCLELRLHNCHSRHRGLQSVSCFLVLMGYFVPLVGWCLDRLSLGPLYTIPLRASATSTPTT